eukprot:6202985-Pleurochrysis_carterae.AAC.2
MHVRWASRAVNAMRRQKVAEFVGKKLSRVIAERHEGCHKTARVDGRLRFVFEKVNGFEACMIIDKHQQVLITRMASANEGPGDVVVD